MHMLSGKTVVTNTKTYICIGTTRIVEGLKNFNIEVVPSKLITSQYKLQDENGNVIIVDDNWLTKNTLSKSL